MLRPFSGLSQDMPCNTHIMNIRTFTTGGGKRQFDPDKRSLLLLHELGVDCAFESLHLDCESSGGKVCIFTDLLQWKNGYSS